MSTEQQEQPEQDDTNSAEGRSLIGQDPPNQNITGYQAKYAASHQRSFFGCLKDRVNTHHTRALLHDPRAWIEIVALLTLGLYTYFAGRQSDAMHDTLVEVRRQTSYANISASAATAAATAAQNAIAQSKDQFVKDQRPYIWVLSNKLGSPEFIPHGGDVNAPTGQIVWTWHYTNYGKSPAYDLRAYRYMGMWGRKKQLSYGWIDPKNRPGTPVPPGADYFETAVSEPGISREDFNKLLKAMVDEGIQASAVYTYRDSAGNPYETGMCFAHLNSDSIQFCKYDNYIK